ncbi:MAG: endonuclease/exonuclease/phosphatase family protein [Kaiparowitsia implicata GSE-PSE-MK54-09C]|nr:endonuclease/exonuclease/phosphatase family protein [Kaiparowitsia implicata GSE-PSE-MK54-09C]
MALLVYAALRVLFDGLAWRYPIELLSHFQLQYFQISGALSLGLGLELVRRRWRRDRSVWLLWVACLVVVLWSGAQLLPYQAVGDRPSLATFSSTPNASTLRVMVANVTYDNPERQLVAQVVQQEDPDLVLFVEVDQGWVADLTAALGDRLPYQFQSPGSDLAMFSKQPLTDPSGDTLGSRDTSLFATIQFAGTPIHVIGVHPPLPIYPRLFQRRNLKLEGLHTAILQTPDPLMVIGDLNVTPWSPYFKRLHRGTHLQDARRGVGVLPTYPSPTAYGGWITQVGHLVQIPIDHCLVSPELQVRQIYTVSGMNSDHKSLVCDLIYVALAP